MERSWFKNFDQTLSRRQLMRAIGAGFLLAGCRSTEYCVAENGSSGNVNLCTVTRTDPQTGSMTLNLKPDYLSSTANLLSPVAITSHEFFILAASLLSPNQLYLRARLQTIPDVPNYVATIQTLATTQPQRIPGLIRNSAEFNQFLGFANHDEWQTVIEDDRSFTGSITIVYRWRDWTLTDLKFRDQDIARDFTQSPKPV